MHKIKFILTVVVSVLTTAFASLYFCSNYFSDIIEKQAEESRLQNIAFFQLLMESLDRGDAESIRDEVASYMSSSLVHSEPEISYSHMYSESCRIHQIIHEYRSKHPEQYKYENEEGNLERIVLEYWDNQNCDI